MINWHFLNYVHYFISDIEEILLRTLSSYISPIFSQINHLFVKLPVFYYFSIELFYYIVILICFDPLFFSHIIYIFLHQNFLIDQFVYCLLSSNLKIYIEYLDIAIAHCPIL